MTAAQGPLVVHTDWSRSWGGQEIRTLTELREMRRLGCRTALIVPQDAELAARARAEGIDVHPVSFSSKFHLRSWQDLFQILRRIRPDVLNSHSSEDSWMAGCVAKLCRIPLIVRTRHVLAPISSALSYNAFPDVILACSESIKAQLLEQGVKANKVIVQPTGIDEQRFQFSAQDRAAVRAEYGISDDEILVGNVGFLRHYKGHKFIIRTAPRTPKHFRFMIVGGGNDQPFLQKEIEKQGMADRFVITGHQEAPERFFSAFDLIFFSSYEAEGVAQSFVQGLLYDLPLLVCRTPSILEPLELIDRYQLIDYMDLEGAAKALLHLAEQRSVRYADVVAKRRKAIADRYGLTAMINNLTSVYRKHGIPVP